jgi:hypothetical protein
MSQVWRDYLDMYTDLFLSGYTLTFLLVLFILSCVLLLQPVNTCTSCKHVGLS